MIDSMNNHLQNMVEVVSELSDADYQALADAVMVAFTQHDKSQGGEATRWWNEIDLQLFVFDRKE
jgi:secreted Zn-dependent insulinase-like peptidase